MPLGTFLHHPASSYDVRSAKVRSFTALILSALLILHMRGEKAGGGWKKMGDDDDSATRGRGRGMA